MTSKIAILTERIHPYYLGGAEKVMYDYAVMLSEKYSMSVYTSLDRESDKKVLNNIHFNRISPKIRNDDRKGNHSLFGILVFSFYSLFHRRKIVNYDLVILDSIHYFYPTTLLKFLKKNNKKIITVFHEAWYKYEMPGAFHSLYSWQMKKLVNRLINFSDSIFSVSNPTTESLVENYNVPCEKILTIPLSIDYAHMHKMYVLNPLLEREYDVIFVGRFARIKRINDLVSAIAQVKLYKEDIKVVLIGDGPTRDEVKAQIVSSGVEKNIILMGFVESEEKFNILNKSRIFVLPSEREGFSIATLEAMALGCVPIVSRPPSKEVFGVSDFVKDQFNGLYYNLGDTSELANSIISLLKHPNRMITLSNQATETAKLYSKEIMREKLLNVVESLLL